MIAIKKNFDDIPLSLINKEQNKNFEENKKAKKYLSESSYKQIDVQEKLYETYNYKCAFCEKSLRDTDKHIEHYRPKSEYFWLAFSWDNLLIACAQCNRKKSSKFKIEGKKVDYEEYQNYKLTDIQNIITKIDTSEKPLLVNPEQEKQEFFNENLSFELFGDNAGQINSDNKRIKHTIKTCDLNRRELTFRSRILNKIKDKNCKFSYKLPITTDYLFDNQFNTYLFHFLTD